MESGVRTPNRLRITKQTAASIINDLKVDKVEISTFWKPLLLF